MNSKDTEQRADRYEDGIKAMIAAGQKYKASGGRDYEEMKALMFGACAGSTNNMLIDALANLFVIEPEETLP